MKEAMKLALDALKAAKHGNCDHAMADEAITALEALAQQEQGPVMEYPDYVAGVGWRNVQPPTQRTWLGLTPEEVAEFDTWHDNREEEVGWCNPSEIVAYIEAKLKEKNT
jgi:hypothetical protein